MTTRAAVSPGHTEYDGPEYQPNSPAAIANAQRLTMIASRARRIHRERRREQKENTAAVAG